MTMSIPVTEYGQTNRNGRTYYHEVLERSLSTRVDLATMVVHDPDLVREFATAAERLRVDNDIRTMAMCMAAYDADHRYPERWGGKTTAELIEIIESLRLTAQEATSFFREFMVFRDAYIEALNGTTPDPEQERLLRALNALDFDSIYCGKD